MSYNGYVVKVKELRQHNNADRLQVATFFGNEVCVDLSVKLGDIGVYFPTDGQLSEEFCEKNNLVRKKDENGNEVGGYMDSKKRNVTTIRLRGEKSDGLYLPISCLEYTGALDLKEGDTITIVNGHEICKKYIPNTTKKNDFTKNGNKTRTKRAPISPLFAEHADTAQLAYNLNEFKCGDEIEITLKMHGTSQRTGYLPVLKKYKRTIIDRLLGREGTPIYDWGYVSGTRRTVLENFEGGFYGSNEFREKHSKAFEGKLWKGETAYYEVVGYTGIDSPIMGIVDNKKTKDKNFIKMYGKTTTFSYGCENGKSDFYVYRMTMTNADGMVVEYTPDFMRYRCEQMGIKCVPLLWKGIIPKIENPGEYIKDISETYYDGLDPIGITHIREGVVCRIINRPKFTAYKNKNFLFKVLEGICKIDATEPDIEEIQEIEE
jgi:hypothetical protein